jgi:hypothetical protein
VQGGGVACNLQQHCNLARKQSKEKQSHLHVRACACFHTSNSVLLGSYHLHQALLCCMGCVLCTVRHASCCFLICMHIAIAAMHVMLPARARCSKQASKQA